jgi:hypothetical protein
MKLSSTPFAVFFMRLPVIPLTFSVAILDKHTRLTRLETDAPLLSAIGTAGVDLIVHHHHIILLLLDRVMMFQIRKNEPKI